MYMSSEVCFAVIYESKKAQSSFRLLTPHVGYAMSVLILEVKLIKINQLVAGFTF